MAITATATVLDSAANLPDGYAKPSLPSITVEWESSYTVDIPITEADAANATTGLNNVLSAIETDFTTTQASDRFGLDSTATINANLIVTLIKRTNTQGVEDGGIFITGTEVFRCTVRVQSETS